MPRLHPLHLLAPPPNNQLHTPPLSTALQYVEEAHGLDLVARLDGIVVGLVGEGEGHDALFLEVGLVDAGEGFGEDDAAAEVAGLQGCVFAGGAFAVVVLGYDEPFVAL